MKLLLYDIHQGRFSKNPGSELEGLAPIHPQELVRSDKVWLFQTQLFHFILKVLDESEVRDLCLPIVYHTKLGKSFLRCLLCVQWRRHVEKGEVLPKQLPHKITYRQLNWNWKALLKERKSPTGHYLEKRKSDLYTFLLIRLSVIFRARKLHVNTKPQLILEEIIIQYTWRDFNFFFPAPQLVSWH